MLELLGLIVVVGALAAYRWSSWVIRYLIGRTYKPTEVEYEEPVSVVVPVFNEEPKNLKRCIESIINNNPDETIIVIQRTENKTYQECVELCKGQPVKLITTNEYGKRPALAIGIRTAKNDLISLVDSDVVWGYELLKKAIMPFSTQKIGAVLVETRALDPKKWHQHLMDLVWDLRNKVEFPFLARFGVASVISGRTAFYRREILDNSLEGLLSERFLGIRLKSGDDKYFTRSLMNTDKNMAYQPVQVYTEVPASFIKMIKQYMRWQRNTWRSDIKFLHTKAALRINRIPLTLYLTDRMLGKVFLVLGTALAMYTIATNLFIGSAVMLTAFTIWWITTRSLKITIGTRTITKTSLIYVPWIIIGAVLSILALVTIYDTGWHTRTGWQRPTFISSEKEEKPEGALVLANW